MTSPSSSLSNASNSDECEVCADTSDGYHYGVPCCRGCNAFFRRAIRCNSQFHCRKDNNCPIVKGARCACRACRLEKCFQVGMDRLAVQPKRGKRKPKKDKDSTTESDTTTATPPTPVDVAVQNPHMPPIPCSPDANCMISRECFDYEERKIRRRTMLSDSVFEIFTDETQLKREAVQEDYSLLFKTQVGFMFEWANSLDCFRRIVEPTDKMKLLRAFALTYMMIDNIWHTIQMGFNDRLVLVNNTFIMGSIPFDFDPHNAFYFGYEISQLLNEIVIPLYNMGFTLAEMMALRLLLFWNPGDIGLTEACVAITQEAYLSSIEDLRLYLTRQQVPNVEERINYILVMLPVFNKYVQILYDTVALIPSFGELNEWEQHLYDILREQ